MSLTLFIAKVL